MKIAIALDGLEGAHVFEVFVDLPDAPIIIIWRDCIFYYAGFSVPSCFAIRTEVLSGLRE